MTENIIDVRINNTINIINIIRYQDTNTKKDIANEVGLSFATVSNICNNLRDQGIVREADVNTLNVGRSPKYILLNYDCYLMACFDFHIRNTVTFTLYDLRINEKYRKEFTYEDNITAHAIVKYCHEMYSEVMSESCFRDKKILGIGVAVPAIFQNESEKIIASGIDIFNNQPIKQYFVDIFKLPTHVDNEANLCAIYESSCRGMGKIQNLIYLFASEGLSVGIVSKGKILTGEHGIAGEICHMPIGSEDFTCHICGQPACITSDLTMRGFLLRYNDLCVPPKTMHISQWKKFVDKAVEGDPKATQVVMQNAQLMGRLLSVLMNLLDPGAICIGGEVSVLFEKMYPQIIDEVNKRLMDDIQKQTQIYPDPNNDTILKGCAEMVFNRFFPLILNSQRE